MKKQIKDMKVGELIDFCSKFCSKHENSCTNCPFNEWEYLVDGYYCVVFELTRNIDEGLTEIEVEE